MGSETLNFRRLGMKINVVDPKHWTLPVGVELTTRNEVYDGKKTKL
jgi:hypothetical protein